MSGSERDGAASLKEMTRRGEPGGRWPYEPPAPPDPGPDRGVREPRPPAPDAGGSGAEAPGPEPVSPEEYAALRRAVGWPSPGSEEIEAALARSVAMAVERDAEGRLIGLARAVGDGMYVLIVDVIVAPEAQGRGIGRRLMLELLERIEDERPSHVALFAAPDVVPFYERLGLRPQDGAYLRR